ncbi:MAG: hypothetical protein ACPGRD_03170 [Planktomarina sp.]
MDKIEFQAFLDRISDCWTDGDFDMWSEHVSLPMVSITRSGQLVNDSLESLRRDWDLYTQTLTTMGVTKIIRNVDVIEPADDSTLIGTYHTQMYAGGIRVVGPYTSSAMLTCESGTWRISSIMNALGHRDWAARQDPN